MALELIAESLNGIKLFKSPVFKDGRGFFLESYRKEDLENFNIHVDFVQDNHSGSDSNVLRGMHFQWGPPQGKLIRVTAGHAMVVEIDIRPGSPTFGQYWSKVFYSDDRELLWVPPGFANGFLAMADWVEIQYKCTAYWNKSGEGSILWNDPAIGIKWPVENPEISEKDKNAMTLQEWSEHPESKVFEYNNIKNIYAKPGILS